MAKWDRELALAWAKEVQLAKNGSQDMPGMAFFVWEGDYGRYEIPQDLAAELLLRQDGWPDKRSPERLKRLLDWVAEQESAALSSKTDTSGASHG